ncbi:MAG TPA: DoxX family protein [Pseudonocardiaceae bacterium]|nr:DoxX family protein [Pseudonocardiaceae bacterium]
MDIVILVGRILFGAVFFGGALGHFTNTAAMSAYTESMGLRPGRLFVIASGLWQLAGAALVVLGVWADLGALMLAVFVVSAAVTMHRFWSAGDAETKMTEQIHFNKDISLAGGALILLGFVVKVGDSLGYTLTGPLFG